MFLTPDLHRDDLWERVDSQLLQYLSQHPELEWQLMDSPSDSLNPSDLFYRSMVLEERGMFVEAKEIENLANAGIYTPEYQACADAQIDYVVEQLSQSNETIIDIASGRGYLVEKLAQNTDLPIIATDFSPRVLRRDRRYWEIIGLYDQMSLLAMDARRTPFRDGAVETLTTNLGLPNIEEPELLLQELRRIVSGSFMAISNFYSEDDEVNATALTEYGLAPLLYRSSAIPLFTSSGSHVEIANTCTGVAKPTPTSPILEAGIDAIPVSETILEWCVLNAH